jgi:flagellar hook-length control protein FliK
MNAAAIPPQTVPQSDSNPKNAASLKSNGSTGKAEGTNAGFDAILSQMADGKNTGELNPLSSGNDLNSALLGERLTGQSQSKHNNLPTPSKGGGLIRHDGRSPLTDESLAPSSTQQLAVGATLLPVVALPVLTSLAAGMVASASGRASLSDQPAGNAAKTASASPVASRLTPQDLQNDISAEITPRFSVPTLPAGSRDQVIASNQPASVPATKILSTHTETHFPPTLGPSPVQQVENALLAQLGESATAADAADPGSSTARQPSADGANSPLKILTIQLEPADLGSVAIKMRLTGNHLDMQVEVTQHDTLQALTVDHDRLRDMLQSCGYSVDGLSIKAAPTTQSTPSDGQTGSPPGQSNSRGQDSSSSFAQSGSDRGDSGTKAAKEDPRSQAPQENRHEVSPTDRIRVGRYI